MKMFFDFLPILLFFGAYKWAGMYVATAVAIVATFAQVSFIWIRHRRVEKMQLVTLGVIVFFGGATLLLHDPTYIKWKPTVIDWLFAAAFLGSRALTGKTLVEHTMGHALTLPGPIWSRLNLAWALFLAVMGMLNLLVAYRFSTDMWVDFKLFGSLGLTLVFVFLQALYLARHVQQPVEEPGEGG
ncbi:MAG TPA: septation protein A [Chromatiales bacterium]|nr:septation protein A [Chromatiales bacterium]